MKSFQKIQDLVEQNKKMDNYGLRSKLQIKNDQHNNKNFKNIIKQDKIFKIVNKNFPKKKIK